MFPPTPITDAKPITRSGELSSLGDFLGLFDQKLRRRNERLMCKLIAWAELLDVAGWCIALKRPDNGGFWLSALAQDDLQESAGMAVRWLDLLEPLNRIPTTRIARRGDGLVIWSPKPAAPLTLLEHGLTQRETEVLSWLREGKTSPEIAIILGCAVRTVEKHLANLYRKIGVRNRSSVILTK